MTIKERCDDFSLVTRSHTSAMPGRDADDTASRAVALLERTDAGKRPVLLLGVGVHGLLPFRRSDPG
jgi:hypothetical protein